MILSLINFLSVNNDGILDMQEITNKAMKGATYPYYFNNCMCCGSPISANFAKQTGNVVYCNPCLSADWKCCKIGGVE